MLVLQAVPNRAWETENATTPASTREDIVGLVRKVALLEGELAEPHRAREAVEEKFCNLFDMSANGMQWLVVSEKEHREQFEELSLLWAQGSEMCIPIIGPPWVRNCLMEGMWATGLRYTEVAGELAAIRATVSFVAKLLLGRSPDETFWVEVMDKLEELCSQLEHAGTRICDLLLGPPLGHAWLTDRLDEVTGHLEVEIAARRKVDAELEAPRTLAAWVWGFFYVLMGHLL
jgi:hypothetical protein